MVDPTKGEQSWLKCFEHIQNYSYNKNVYEKMHSKKVSRKERQGPIMPALVFMPSQAVCRVMIRANLVFSHDDTEE